MFTDAGLSGSEMAHQGVMGFALLGHGRRACEIPGAEAGHSARQHRSPKAVQTGTEGGIGCVLVQPRSPVSEFKPTVSSSWGPFLSHPTKMQYILEASPCFCIFLS